eukprot:352225-Chlamydomonas_euryale.AAC.9
MQTAQQASLGQCGPSTAWMRTGKLGNGGGLRAAAPNRLPGRLLGRLHGRRLHGRPHGLRGCGGSSYAAEVPCRRAARAVAAAAARRDVLAIGTLSLLGPEVAPQRGDCPTCESHT